MCHFKETLHFLFKSYLLFANPLTLFQTSPGFYESAETSYLKTLWEKEKLLVMSNFSLSHSVFNPFGEFFAIFVIFEMLSANAFSSEESEICHLGKG